MFTTGVPTGGTPDPSSGPLVAIITVNSVGPYAFTIRRPGAHRAASSPSHASPPTTSTPNPPSPSAGTPARTLGTISAWVIACWRSTAASSGPATGPPGGGTTSVPPAANARQTSSTLASNPAEASCATRHPGYPANRSTSAAAKLGRPPWVTPTPFGVPVDPEV